MNLQELLINYFRELPDDIKEIVSEVYSLERENNDFYDGRQQLTPKIKDIIDRVARYEMQRDGERR